MDRGPGRRYDGSVPNAQLVVEMAAVGLAVVSVALQGKRLAAKTGGARVVRVVIVSLTISAAVVVWMVSNRQHQRAKHPPPSAYVPS